MVLVCNALSCHDDHLCLTKLQVGHEPVSLKSMHKVKVQTLTLTFDLATWFLFATHCLVMMIICAKLFSNPTMHNSYGLETNRFH